MENQTVNEGKITAIVSYLWWVGLIIAFLMNNDKKNLFASFHIRQSLGLLIVLSVLNILEWQLQLGFISWLLDLALFVLWIIGLIGALQGEEKEVPIFGHYFQDWFKNIG
jgi:uncharacterized membrane protein